MPIKPENRGKYPKNWSAIRQKILLRANNRCEWCGAPNHLPNLATGSKVVLTIMHLDHDPENCRMENLRAACQLCHNRYDAPHRQQTRRQTREKALNENQGQLFDAEAIIKGAE